MPSFAYVAREAGTGREIRSNLDASTEQAAIAALLNRNLLVVSIQERIGKKGRTSGGRVVLSSEHDEAKWVPLEHLNRLDSLPEWVQRSLQLFLRRRAWGDTRDYSQ